ncbi:acyltransferase family protein [Epilithonimonas sp. UC225_85]|uniref:acyltransferase family protein n=1 Tax=Epilithonimonas sp. UC225_85 TaxID=3350167 RepID=UPI0036D35A37
MGILRILLAISVVLAHTSSLFGVNLVGGQTAVQIFYIISGFYMALVLNEKYVAKNNSYFLFISNRLLRLYPIYWVILILTILFSCFIYYDSQGSSFGSFDIYISYYNKMSFGSFAFLVFTNIFLFLQDIVMFLKLNLTTGHLALTTDYKKSSPMLFEFLLIPQAWTIGVEIAFYIIVPFIARKKIQIIIFLIALSVLLRIVLYYYLGYNKDPWTYRFFPTELVFFLLGIIAYHIYNKIKEKDISPAILNSIWISVIAITFLYSFINIEFKEIYYCILFFTALPFIFILTKRNKIDTYIGELSYPIYISHWLVVIVINYFKIPYLESSGVVVVSITIIFSILLNEFIAKKVEKIRQKRVRK